MLDPCFSMRPPGNAGQNKRTSAIYSRIKKLPDACACRIVYGKKGSTIDSARNKLHSSCHLAMGGLLSRGMYAIVFLYVPFILRRIIDSRAETFFSSSSFSMSSGVEATKIRRTRYQPHPWLTPLSLTTISHSLVSRLLFVSSVSPFVFQPPPFLLLLSTFRCTLVLRATFANNER